MEWYEHILGILALLFCVTLPLSVPFAIRSILNLCVVTEVMYVPMTQAVIAEVWHYWHFVKEQVGRLWREIRHLRRWFCGSA